jgi:four helix bundle protein
MGRASSQGMVATRFEELDCWQLARELERRVFAFTSKPPASKDLDYCRQIRKSSSSAPPNIAEGFGRYYPGDFARFTRNALGSLNETRDHLGAGFEKQYLTEDVYRELKTLANRAIGASVNLVKYLDACKERWDRERRARNKRGAGSRREKRTGRNDPDTG